MLGSLKFDKWLDEQVQQTPNPPAQDPLATPPLALHSDAE
jgi:hypothetical protein